MTNSAILIKFKDIDGNIKSILNEKKIKNKITFTENINWPQWELKIVIDEDFNKDLDIFSCEVFVISKYNPLWRLVYTWIMNKIKSRRKKFSEKEYSFVWYGALLENTKIFDYEVIVDEKIKILDEWEKEGTVNDYLDLILWNLKTEEITWTKSWLFVIWEEITWWTSGAVWILKWQTDLWTIWVELSSWQFEDGETLTWTTSTNTLSSITVSFETTGFRNLLSKWDITTSSTEFINKFWYTTNLSALKSLTEQKSSLYFYIWVNGVINFTEKPTSAWNNNILIWDREVFDIEFNNDFDITNKVYLKWKDGDIVISKNTESIKKYWLFEKNIDDTLLTTIVDLQERADSYIEEHKDPNGEVVIKVGSRYDEKIWDRKTWNDLNGDWDSYNQSWGSFWASNSVYDFCPWMMINIRNFDNDKQLTNLLIVRKSFSEDWITLHCNRYENYTNNILNKTKEN